MSNEAITVASEVTINHWELGRKFAEWDNLQQALFLHGLAVGLDEMKGADGLQLLSIAEAAKADGTLGEIQDLARLLQEYLGGLSVA